MKKSIYVLAILLMVTLVGCKRISTERLTVQVKIIDAHYRPAHIKPNPSSSKYRITVEYDGDKYYFRDRETYNKYSSRVGEYVNGTLQIRKYDNGTVLYDMISLE